MYIKYGSSSEDFARDKALCTGAYSNFRKEGGTLGSAIILGMVNKHSVGNCLEDMGWREMDDEPVNVPVKPVDALVILVVPGL